MADNYVAVWVVAEIPLWRGMWVMGVFMHVWGQGVHEESLTFLPIFLCTYKKMDIVSISGEHSGNGPRSP